MQDLYVVTSDRIPKKLHGSDMGYALRPISRPESISIEDRLFKQGEATKVQKGVTALIIPDISINFATIENYETLAEFWVSLLTLAGHFSFFLAALFSDGVCTYAKLLMPRYREMDEPRFSAKLNGAAVSQWIRRCSLAHKNLKERMHITATRYVKYARANDLSDGLLDLCISLESLLDSQTEVSFRFGACLAKLTGEKGQRAEDMASLLSKLYDIRSKIVHGDPAAAKLMNQIEPKLAVLHASARRILTTYMLFMSEHTRDEWKAHLRSCLFA